MILESVMPESLQNVETTFDIEGFRLLVLLMAVGGDSGIVAFLVCAISGAVGWRFETSWLGAALRVGLQELISAV